MVATAGHGGSANFGRNLAAGLAACGGRSTSRGSAATTVAAGEGVPSVISLHALLLCKLASACIAVTTSI